MFHAPRLDLASGNVRWVRTYLFAKVAYVVTMRSNGVFHQIWSGQVTSVCVFRQGKQGACSPMQANILTLEAERLLLRSFCANLLGFIHLKLCCLASLKLARLIVCLQEWHIVGSKTRKRFLCTVHCHLLTCHLLTSFNMSPSDVHHVHVGGLDLAWMKPSKPWVRKKVVRLKPDELDWWLRPWCSNNCYHHTSLNSSLHVYNLIFQWSKSVAKVCELVLWDPPLIVIS